MIKWLVSALLASLPAASAAAEEPGQLYVLRQWDAGHVYFRPANEPLCFSLEGENIRTNALVFVRFPADMRGSAKAQALVSTWIDPKGHLHTVQILDEQADFSHSYDDWVVAARNGDCNGDSCRLTDGWKEAVTVENPAPTGILGEDYFLIAYRRLVMRLDALSRRARGHGAEQSLHRFLTKKIAAAREALARFRQASTPPMTRPEPPASAAIRKSPHGLAGGLKLGKEDLPKFVDFSVLDSKPRCYKPKDPDATSEVAVEASVDPRLPEYKEWMKRYKAAGAEAEDAINKAEMIAHELQI